jgi:predicted HTH transcriptional regulator
MDLKKIISQGESERLEFKESPKLKDKVGESISSFSNSENFFPGLLTELS